MRVLFINQVFHPSAQSTGQHLSDLAEALIARGHEVTVLTCRRADDDPSRLYPARETWRGIEIIRVLNTHLGRGSKWRRIVDFLSFYVAASWRALFFHRFDFVITLTTPPLISVLGAILSLWWRARFIYWVMDLFPDEAVAIGWLRQDSPLTRLMETISVLTLRRADCVIALDPYMRERLIAKGVRPEKIASISIWMHREVAFDPAGRRRFREQHQLEGKYVVMYSGNHSPCHPLDTLIAAARLVKDDPTLHFCFIGGGTEWGRWRARSREEGWTNATFLGYQPFEELSASLSAADTQVVAMGDPFVGIVHPGKVYNFLAARRPFIYIGPGESHVTDLIREGRLETVAASFRHGESRDLAEELRRRAQAGDSIVWPPLSLLSPWSETALLEKIVLAMGA